MIVALLSEVWNCIYQLMFYIFLNSLKLVKIATPRMKHKKMYNLKLVTDRIGHYINGNNCSK
jgi:uncharacterized membrane protein